MEVAINYYPHHIGDYITATAHLTMIEDGAYRRLLDLYYSTEKQLPLDRKALYRVARARTPEEQEAVDIVLEEFFEETEEGWFHSRCEEEIDAARDKGEEAQDKRKNERERQRRHRERRKELFEALREHGVVPPWDTKTADLETLLSQYPSKPVTRDKPVTVTEDDAPPTRTATAIHKPIPIPIPITNTKEEAAAATPPPRVRTHARKAGDDSPPSPPKPEKANPLPDGPARYAVLIRRWERERGKASRTTSSDPRLTTWAEKGITEGQLREAYDMAVADRELNGDTTVVSAGFIDVFLTKVLNPPEGESALSRAGPPGTAKPWQASWSGIVAKGAELGLQQDPDETPPEFKARVFAAVAMTEEEKSTLRADWGVQV